MTDIEKKAREYAEQIGREYEYDGRESIAKQAFLAGAAYSLGNQWRDAEKEKPEYESIIKQDDKYGFLRDLKECLTKHHAHINAYHIEDDKLVIDLDWLYGALTIGPSDDIKINNEWISNELEGN